MDDQLKPSIYKFNLKNQEWSQIYTIFIASLSGFTSLATIAWSSPSVPILTSNTSYIGAITFEEATYFPLIPATISLIMCPFVGVVFDLIGRKKLFILMVTLQIASWSVVALAQKLIHLYISRVFSGISDAISCCLLPAYMGEISTPKVRVIWGNLLLILPYSGQLLINIIGSYCTIKTTALIFLSVPVIQLLGILFIPESPYYLLTKHKTLKAEKSLKKLRLKENVEEEFNCLVNDVERQISEPGNFKHLFLISTNLRALLICIAMQLFEQLSGVAAFSVYTQTIFSLAGKKLSASLSAIIYSSVLLVTSCIYLFVVDKLGRRSLMLISSIGASIALFAVAAYFYVKFETDLNVSNYGWIPLAAMIMFTSTSTGGIAILPSIMTGELFSSSIKGFAMGTVNLFSFVFIIASLKLFDYLFIRFGMYVPFLMYGVCTTISIFFYYMFLPETRSKTLEEIQQSLRNKK